MFCKKCGCQNPDSVNFCQRCGAFLGTPEGTSGGPRSVRGTQPAASVVKTAASSSLFLTGTIMYTVFLVFQFFNSIWGRSELSRFLYQYAYELDMEDILPLLTGSSVVTAVIRLIPGILVAVGLWMVYAAGRDRRTGSMKTSGMTMIKVMMIISLVCFCIVTAFVLIALVIAMVAANQAISYYGGYGGYSSGFAGRASTAVFVGIMIGVCIAAVLVILYYVKIVKSINTVKMTILSGVLSDRVSIYVSVICFISGAFTALGGLLSIVTNLMGTVESLASAAASIIFGIVIISYRNQVRMTMTPDFTVPYGTAGQGASAASYPLNGYGRQSSQGGGAVHVSENPVNVAETSVLHNSAVEETTVLKNSMSMPKLMRVKDGSFVLVNTPDFRIGKDPSAVDLYISDNSAVSRVHASILTEPDGYYVVDHNSTNYVYVDGQMIQSESPVRIVDGTRIRLADEEFVFKLK